MIKQMERRFTLVAVSVVSLVMMLIIVTVNMVTIHTNIQSMDRKLERLMTEPAKRGKGEQGDAPEYNRRNSENTDRPIFDKSDNRSFAVIIHKDLSLISTNSADKKQVDDATAYEMALLSKEDGKDYGFVGDYRYAMVAIGDEIHFLFMDYSFEKNVEDNLLFISMVVFGAAVALVALLVRLFIRPVLKPARESYTRQKQFITDASHELKTPLTVIATNMQLIEMENGSSDWTRSISNQIERMKSLTNELVTLARMDEEVTSIEMGKVNLSELVNDVVMGFEPSAVATDKSLVSHIEEEIVIKGNYDTLERVMSILMNNALKYSDVQGTIQVDLYRKGKKVRLAVTNTAEPIQQGNHDHFFERFYRSDESRNSENGGFGIGLAVAKAIIEEHKGKIEAISPDGHSLVIKITL